MVRDIIGMLFLVGSHKKEPYFSKYTLDQKNKRIMWKRAPPYGLYLANVMYPNDKNFDINCID